MRAQSHIRAEKGTTCHCFGRCRLPNAYLYDREIVPRVARFNSLEPKFADSSIWVLGQRRWVYLKGCVRDAQQARPLESEVRPIDDVEAVVNKLMVGTDGKPPYATVQHRGAARSACFGAQLAATVTSIFLMVPWPAATSRR